MRLRMISIVLYRAIARRIGVALNKLRIELEDRMRGEKPEEDTEEEEDLV